MQKDKGNSLKWSWDLYLFNIETIRKNDRFIAKIERNLESVVLYSIYLSIRHICKAMTSCIERFVR